MTTNANVAAQSDGRGVSVFTVGILELLGVGEASDSLDCRRSKRDSPRRVDLLHPFMRKLPEIRPEKKRFSRPSELGRVAGEHQLVSA